MIKAMKIPKEYASLGRGVSCNLWECFRMEPLLRFLPPANQDNLGTLGSPESKGKMEKPTRFDFPGPSHADRINGTVGLIAQLDRATDF